LPDGHLASAPQCQCSSTYAWSEVAPPSAHNTPKKYLPDTPCNCAPFAQVPMVDVIFADVAQPDQARIVGLNAQYFLKNNGNFVISIKASCIDSTAPPEAVFAREVSVLPACLAGCLSVCARALLQALSGGTEHNIGVHLAAGCWAARSLAGHFWLRTPCAGGGLAVLGTKEESTLKSSSCE